MPTVTIAVVLLVLLVVGVAAAVRTLRARHVRPLDQVSAFAAARDVTNRWSDDPASTPKPLQDYLGSLHQPTADGSDRPS